MKNFCLVQSVISILAPTEQYKLGYLGLKATGLRCFNQKTSISPIFN